MIASQNSSTHIEVSITSVPLTLPEFNSNYAHSGTATLPNLKFNEETNSDKYRHMECKE